MEHIVSFDFGAMMAKPCARGPLIAAPGGGSHGSCPSQFSIFVTIAAMSRLAVLAAKLQALACHTMRVKEWQDDVVLLAKVAGLPKSLTARAEKVLAVLEKGEQGAGTRAARRWSPALQGRRRAVSIRRRGAATRNPPGRADPARGARPPPPAESAGGGISLTSTGQNPINSVRFIAAS